MDTFAPKLLSFISSILHSLYSVTRQALAYIQTGLDTFRYYLE